MEQLDKEIQNKESTYLQKVEEVLKEDCSDRTKLALIYQACIRCQNQVSDLIYEAQKK